jgi:hypothetical protein
VQVPLRVRERAAALLQSMRNALEAFRMHRNSIEALLRVTKQGR